MATNNSGNNQVRESRPRTNNYNREGKSFPKNGEEKRTGRPRTNNYQGNGEYKPRNNGQYRRGNGSHNGYDKGFGKDEDDEREVRRKPVQKDTKPKEQQTEKIEIKNRLEKEKKAMKKKQDVSRKDNKAVKHQAKPKRSGNIDWTRAYENDSYDDDEFDMYY